jgi:cobalt/nickel transport system permease protein
MTLPRAAAIADSPLARWDGRWKLAGLFGLGFAAATVRTPVGAVIALGIAIGLIILGRFSMRSVVVIASVLLSGVVPLAVAMPFLGGGGWGESLALVCRGLAVGLIGHAAFASSPPHRSFAALARLRVPGLFVNLLQFGYRYAILLAGEVRRVRVAMAVRGFRAGLNRRTYATTGHLIGSVLVRGGDRAEAVAAAMAARGFDGTYRTLTPFRTSVLDVIGFVVTSVLGGVLIAIEAMVRG